MNKESTKLMLADSLKQLMLLYDFDLITVTQIADHANISRRTFYRYFVDKYALLEYIFQSDFQPMIQEHLDWTMSQIFPLICEKIYNNREFYKKAFKISGQNGFREYSVSSFDVLIRKDAYSLFQSPALYKRISESFSYITFDCFVDWLNTEPVLKPDEFSQLFLHDIYVYYDLQIKQIRQVIDES